MASREEEDFEVDAPPMEIDPYTTLNISADATADDVKKAYRKAALKYHPDKAAEADKAAAHTKFQEIAFAYAILSDERRRKRYDVTGNTSESLDLDHEDFDWLSFYRGQFENVVTEETITNFSKEYKGSEEEKEHVLDAYEKVEGHMGRLYQAVMLSEMLEDEDRFRAIIDAAIESGEVEAYPKYTGESENARMKRMEHARKDREKRMREAEKAEKELTADPKSKKNKGKAGKGEGNMGDLAALIQQRQKGRAEGFFDHLEAKYASESKPGKGKKGAKRTAVDDGEPSEEAFAKNRKAGKADEGEAVEGARKSKRSKKA